MAFTDDVPDNILDDFLEIQGEPLTEEDPSEMQEREIQDSLLSDNTESSDNNDWFSYEPYLEEHRGALASK